MRLRGTTLVGAVCALVALAALTVGGATAAPDPGAATWTEVQNAATQLLDVPEDVQDAPLAVVLELEEPATATVFAAERKQGKSKKDAGRAAKAQKAKNENAQEKVLRALGSKQVLFSTQAAYNGVAVMATRAEMAELATLEGVKDVHELPVHTRDTASAVPLMGGPKVWEAFGDAGDDVTIAIIDTGVDYVHAGLGGRGLAADWAAAKSAGANPLTASGSSYGGITVMSGDTQIFPSAKVVGGWDLVGDAYTGTAPNPGQPAITTPSPDPNPLDCGGHGSHVAGIAAGNGVAADGSSYTGPYDTSIPFESMLVGPGMAPKAKILAIRVFGCVGNTTVTLAGVDRAVDPNQDGDVSDHVDIINMSLGSDYGTPDDPSAQASVNASKAGVIVANSAGNSLDMFYVSGSPGSNPFATTVANTADDIDVADGFRVNEPAAIAGVHGGARSQSYPWLATSFAAGVTPVPVTAELYYPASSGTGSADPQYGCTTFSPTEAAKIAGRILLVDWRKPGDLVFPSGCGSAVRANVATAAGAKGIIMVDTTPYLDTAIAGNDKIPGIYTVSTVGNALKAHLTPGTPSSISITMTPELVNAGKIVTEGRADTISPSTSRGPSSRSNALKPDLGAVGVGVFAPDVGSLNKGTSKSGTSMAAPHVAGTFAILKNLHPDWTPAQLKAVLMNTATNDLYEGLGKTGNRYGPGRVGAGRIDVEAAVKSQVIAYNEAEPGVVSVSFGTLQVQGTQTWEKSIEVFNRGDSAVTYAIGYDARVSIPGVSYSFPDGDSITVPAGAKGSFRVQLTADASQMKNTRDATILAVQGGNPRHWLAEAGGNVTLTPATGQQLVVPVYANGRPASSMGTTQGVLAFPTPTGSTTLGLSGTGVKTGTTPALDWTSLVSAFELARTSPKLGTLPGGATESARHADIQHVGVTSNVRSGAVAAANRKLYFALSMWDDWTTLPTELGITINIDTGGTSAADYQVFQTRFTETDVWVTATNKLTAPTAQTVELTNVYNSNLPTGVFNTNVVVLPVSIPALNLGSPSRIRYWVSTTSRFWGTIDTVGSQAAPLTFDPLNPGIDFTGGAGSSATTTFFEDLPGGTIPATFNQTAFTANGSLGALLFHHLNTKGNRTQVLNVAATSAVTVTPATADYSDPATLTATVASTFGGSPAGSVEFFVGGSSVGTAAVGAGGVASLSVPNLRSPAVYPVRAEFTSTNASQDGSVGTSTLTVTAEDADVAYSGPFLVSTPSTSATTAAVNLVAQVRDVTAYDAASDPNGGDIRTATVTFVNRNGGATLCTAPVVLTGEDTLNGEAGCSFTASLGSANSVTYTVGMVVGGNYVTDRNVVVTVSKPLGNEFVTGGGSLVNTRSAGSHAGTAGEATGFGLNAKYKKNGSAQGNATVVVVSNGRTYQVRANVLESLVANTTAGTATLGAKANITDITNALAPVTVETSAALQITLTDRGEPGKTDSIGIQVRTKTGALWFSSAWNGSRTAEQTLAGGNLVVR